MKIIQLIPDANGLIEWPTLSTTKKSVITVGVFDGMHRGHRAVLERTVALAKQDNAYAVAIMFDPRPQFVHEYANTHGGQEPEQSVCDTNAISSVDERLRIMSNLGIDIVMLVHYTLEFAAKSFRFFIGQLVGKVGMRALVLGSDAQMGANREGTIERIALLAEATGVFELDVVADQGPGTTRVPQVIEPSMPQGRGEPADPMEGLSKAERRALTKQQHSREVRVWSSTNIRNLLSMGRVMAANEILDASHGVEGTVIHGEERGRTIGFPTANVEEPMEGFLPVDGVYAGWLIDLGPQEAYDHEHATNEMSVYDDHGANSRLAAHSPYRWPAAISIGTKPTFSEQTGRQERVLEANAITDEWLDLYGHRVRVEFAQFLRPQIKFDSADDLAQELARNAQETLNITQNEQ